MDLTSTLPGAMYATPRLLAIVNSFGSGFSSLSPETGTQYIRTFWDVKAALLQLGPKSKGVGAEAGPIKVRTFQLPRVIGFWRMVPCCFNRIFEPLGDVLDR